MAVIIETRGVTKVFNPGLPDEIQAVTDVSLEVHEGEIAVIKGPSGSGKTSLLSLIGCMSRPTAGSIRVRGKDVARIPERFLTSIRRMTFGFIFQQFNLIRGISVVENVLLPLYPTDAGIAEMRERADAVLEKLEISKKRNFAVQRLSGGEQQRVAIARALINDPDILLADEPTAHLDTKLSGDFISIVRKLNGEGKTIIIATHDPLVHENPFIRRIIRMRDGMVREVSVH